MKFWLVITIGFLGVSELWSQNPGSGRPELQNLPAEGIVTGRITEKSGQIPMEYANIVLFSARDSSIVTGTVTDAMGTFRLVKVPYGRYYAVANFIGYEKTYLNDLRITPKEPAIDLGTIYLEAASTALEGVEVVADRSHVEYMIDKKVINVSQDILSAGGSAISVLENTPSVQVDIEGNVSLRGTSNFTVLIDGRPSVLKGSDALQQIPASNIQQIEIITNPSAKYDPDGVGGIINVLLKKQQKSGINGVINASLATGNKYSFDGLVNYRFNKFNVFAGLDVNYREFNMKGSTSYETYYPDSTEYRDSDMRGEMNRKGFGIKGGADYFISDKTTVTLSGRYGGYGFGRDRNIQRQVWAAPYTGDWYSASKAQSEREGNYSEANLSSVTRFNQQGHQLEFLAFYSNRTGDDWEEQEDYTTDSNWNRMDNSPELTNTNETSSEYEVRLKADYTRPVRKKGKIEAGYQSRFESENEVYTFNNFDYALNEWVENSLYTSEMEFNENIHSLYGIYSDSWGSFGYQAGLRGEITDRNIQNKQSAEPSVLYRFDYFPTLHVSKQFPGDHQVLASYGRRINRPDGRQLDPFITYMDPYNYRAGNPDLKPEYTDSYELAYQKKMKSSFISLETYYRVTQNKISSIKTLQSDGSFLHTFQNLNKDFSLGAEVMLNYDVTRAFNVTAILDVFDYRLEGTVEGEDVDSRSTNWNGRLNLTLKLIHDFRIQLMNLYNGPSVTAQGESMASFMMNVGVRKVFYSGRFIATLSVNDLLATGKRESISQGEDFYSHDKFRREAPILTLNLSYVINDYKRQRDNNATREESGGEGMDIGF